jgi:hypothetical protein
MKLELLLLVIQLLVLQLLIKDLVWLHWAVRLF